jgi:hypothetical protein
VLYTLAKAYNTRQEAKMSGQHRQDKILRAAWLTPAEDAVLQNLPGATLTAKFQVALLRANEPLPTLAEQVKDLEWREVRSLLKALVKQAKVLGWQVTLVLPQE